MSAFSLLVAVAALRYRPTTEVCCAAGLADPICSCNITQWICGPDDYERICTAQPPLNEAFLAEVRFLAARRPAAPCKWDHTEALLLAFADERALIMEWVRSWVTHMSCFPALHVLSDIEEEESSFRGLFWTVPNVTFHTLNYPFPMDRPHAIEWPMLWADNFTSARHVLIHSTASPLIRPTRCHQLFNQQGVPVWHSWRSPFPWREVTDELMKGLIRARRALNQALPEVGWNRHVWRGDVDLMTFFPFVIPRAALPATRHLIVEACAAGVLDGPAAPGHSGKRFLGMQNGSVLRAQGACGDFDSAFMALLSPSFADLIGKAALFLTPSDVAPLIKWQPCDPRARPGGHASPCLDFAPATFHVARTQKDTKMFAPWPETQALPAAEQVKRRVAEELAFANSWGNLSLLPESFFYYNLRHRPGPRVREIAHSLLRADADGEFCGVPHHAATARGE